MPQADNSLKLDMTALLPSTNSILFTFSLLYKHFFFPAKLTSIDKIKINIKKKEKLYLLQRNQINCTRQA